MVIILYLFFLLLQIHAIAKSNDIFTEIFNTNYWGNVESISGSGSTLQQTEILRAKLPLLLSSLKIKSILDAPCGDLNWIRTVDLDQYEYIGIDIVEQLILNNQRIFPNKIFLLGNILDDSLPKVDLILCRDCLVHFPNNYIKQALKNFKKSGSKYLLTTIFTNPKRRVNIEISMGEWRPIDLQRDPFNLKKPILIINEKCTESNNIFNDKSLALWDLSELKLK